MPTRCNMQRWMKLVCAFEGSRPLHEVFAESVDVRGTGLDDHDLRSSAHSGGIRLASQCDHALSVS